MTLAYADSATHKTCRRCNTVKPRLEFPRRRDAKDPNHSWCKACMVVAMQRWRTDDPERAQRADRATKARAAAENRVSSLRHVRRIGIEPEDYLERLEAQQGQCAICGGNRSKRRLHADHDHESGRFRGLLCGPCNRALGYFADDVAFLRAAIDYLERDA